MRTAVALLACLALLSSPAPAPAEGPQATYVLRVPAPMGDSAQRLLGLGYDVLEQRDGADLFVVGDPQTPQKLRGDGFPSTVETAMPPSQRAPRSLGDATYYGGYRTVTAQFAHLNEVARAHPDLATVVDYGDSWRKTQGSGGHDLKAICITRKSPGDCALTPTAPKPRLFVMGQLHAREITTGDMAWRFIDDLVGSDLTAKLGDLEVWVVPIANPDGVEIVESGGDTPVLHRKNANGTCTSGSRGVDLNRNAGSHWGEVGSSPNKCSETYRGTRADSEVEVQALESLWRKLYRDTRPPGDTAAASADTTGAVISMHSYGDYVLFPWGWSTQKTGNDAALRKMANDQAALSGFTAGQPGELLYNASGATDDWVYDDLGVPSFVWEIGAGSGRCGGFLPPFSCQQDVHWPKVRPMLVSAMNAAKRPY
ncbi:M14 family zinc carboxypeptidase [Lentzea flaviverrucosa]|uniref:Zinc carboxypeptidase n=1 Tax=Lentzea flaviverrucosa TaxID=200379 RepID=A0A1H9RY02_9PSEU|nr:M14 family zinc carboxypeptidase [Lentzea flaviverrucosa]RDI33199.1 zinc carboxypeptidase [Lentzea flaviverrucosa]SER77672.1 Zinc carboxypeptidase [Lentzea flaviverrucosa]